MLTAEGLRYGYGAGPAALAGVSFALDAGERVLLLGANGAGKSTLLAHCNGLLRPTAGELRLEGEAYDYTRAGLRRLRRRVTTVLQNAEDQLFGGTAEQDLALGPLEAGASEREARRAAREALERFGAAHLAGRPVHGLSVGEKKRVALAGATMTRPAVLLLDEPTAGLDLRGTESLLEVLEAIRREGTLIVMASHDTAGMLPWADRVLVLREGELVYDGTAGRLADGWVELTAGCGLRAPLVTGEALLR